MDFGRSDYNETIVDTTGTVPANMPVFLIKATDPVGADALRYWAQRNAQIGGDTRMSESARIHADKMDEWADKQAHADFPDGYKAPAAVPGMPRYRRPEAEPRQQEDAVEAEPKLRHPHEPRTLNAREIGHLEAVRNTLRQLDRAQIEQFHFRLTKALPMTEYPWFPLLQALFTQGRGTQMEPLTEHFALLVCNERKIANQQMAAAGR